METESAAQEVMVPVKVPQPADDAPPTLAEPASGPAAEMSGAIPGASSTEVPAPSVPEPALSAPADLPASENAPTTEATSTSAVPDTSEAPTQADVEVEKRAEADVAAPSTDEPVFEANGTPAGKKGENGKRKSIGVPEHKGKKLNKKKSMAKITHLDAKPGDYFFARLKSYPPWPSMVCDEDILPESLLTTRPITTMKADGTYNEAYADGGKKVTDRTFPVMFLYTNEFAWIPNTDLGPLNPEDCKDVSEKGKAKSLVAAYQVAAEGHDLDHFKNMLMEHAKAMEDEELRRQELADQKAAKADKKKRKSETKVEDDNVDMADADDAEVKKSAKKRKKAAESDDEAPEKAAKTPKTTKLKLTTNKTPASTEKKPKEKPAKAKTEKRKSKAPVSDEEMVDAPEEEEVKSLDPVEARKAREREVLFLRHKLQKGFLSRDQAPQEEDMPQMSQYIKKLENYEDLEVSIIRTTKINKVLKALVKLNTIPRDEEFSFRKRSVELLGKWNKILGAEPEGDNGTLVEEKDSKSTPTTNGVHSEEKKDEPEPPTETTAMPAETLEKVPEVDADAETKPDIIAEPQEETKQPTVETAETTSARTLPAVPVAERPKTETPAVTETAVVEKAPESVAAVAESTEAIEMAD